MIANPKTVVLEELLQELRAAGDQWIAMLDAKLQDATYNRGNSDGSEHVSLEAYVETLSPHCVIACSIKSRRRSKADIIKDIVAAIRKLIHVPKTIDLEELLQELRNQGDQWQTVLDSKLQEARHSPGKSVDSEHVSLEAYVDALNPHCDSSQDQRQVPQ